MLLSYSSAVSWVLKLREGTKKKRAVHKNAVHIMLDSGWETVMERERGKTGGEAEEQINDEDREKFKGEGQETKASEEEGENLGWVGGGFWL